MTPPRITPALLILDAQGMDLLTTLLLVASVGIGGEVNGLASRLVGAFGLQGLLLLKGTGTVLMIPLVLARNRGSQLRLALAAGSGLLLAAANTLLLYLIR